MSLPTYEMVINPEESSDVEVSFVALVDKPAIERNFMAFKDGFGGPGSGPNPGGGSEDSKDLGSMTDDELTVHKNKLIEKANNLVEKKNKLFPNPDIESAMSPEEKELTREIAKVQSEANAVVIEKRKRKKSGAGMMSKMTFAINEEKRIISGPAMIADQLIYRKDENGEYNVFFSPDTVRDIALKFFKKDYQKNLNLFHDPNLSLQGVTIFESFVSDTSRGIQGMKGYEDLPDGTWFISAKVENDEVWQAIKGGQVKGFSVEGIFSFMKLNRPVANSSHLFKEESNIMSDIKELWNQFKEKFMGGVPATPNAPAAPATPEKMSQEYTLKDGTVVTAEVLEPGGVLMVGDVPAPAGVHEFQDGTKVTVAEGGLIQSVEPALAPADPAAPADYSEQFKSYDEKFSTWDQKFTEHINAYNTMSGEFNSLKEKFSAMADLVGKLIETPTAESVQGNKGQFNSNKPAREEKLKELASLFSTIKKK